MNFRNWLRSRPKNAPVTNSRAIVGKRTAHCRLEVESLEDRTVPTVITIGDLPAGNTTSEIDCRAGIVVLTATASENVFDYSWAASRNGNYFQTGHGSSFNLMPDDNGTVVVNVMAIDSDGSASGFATATITVVNSPPTLEVIQTPNQGGNPYFPGAYTPPVPVGTLVTFGGSPWDVQADREAGFTYNWSLTKEGTDQLPAGTDIHSSGLSFTPMIVGDYVLTLTVVDKDGGTTSVNKPLTVTTVDATSLQNEINKTAGGTIAAITLQTDSTLISSVINAVNALYAPLTYNGEVGDLITAPLTVTLDLASGTYNGTTVHPQANVTLIINGTADSTTFVGHSPAFTVEGGNVIINDVSFTNSTDFPTILVTDGNLTLRNDTIQESTGYAAAAISVTGGTVDLGTTADPGGNILNVNGTGELIHNTGTNPITVIGNTFEKDATVLTSPYRIQDLIYSSPSTGGLVSFVDNTVYVTCGSANIQRGIDSVADGGIVNVESSVNARFTIGTKLVTVKFEDGSSVGLQPDPLNTGQVMLVVTGTATDDTIRIMNADDDSNSIKVKLGSKDLGNFKIRGTSSSNLSRIVVRGQAGNDTITVDNDVTIPAWLYGGTGDDELRAGGGSDFLYGEDGNDKLFARGGGGSDRLDGGAGNDMLYAGAGGDMLFGGPGNDNLKGGSGNDILVGGDGDDLIAGGAGRDLIIGGLGADKLVGDADDDILIAGATAFDANDTALKSIMAEWSSTRDYATRLANLMGTGTGTNFQARLNGTVYLKTTGADATVFDDGAVDVLTGNAGQDWFIFNATGSGVHDQVTDLKAGEFFTDLDILFINGL